MAREFLNSTAFQIAKDKLTEKVHASWLASGPDQKAAREDLYLILKNFEAMEKQIKIILDEAEIEIQRQEYKNG